MTRKIRVLKEFSWAMPFIGIALIVCALLRPEPSFQSAASETARVVVDGSATPVVLDEPFRGAVFTWGPGFGAGGWLEATGTWQGLARMGTQQDKSWSIEKNDIWLRIFPQLLKNDRLWDMDALNYAHGSVAEVERMLAIEDAGAFFGGENGPAPLLRQVGLPVLYLGGDTPGGSWDDFLRSAARLSGLVSGQAEAAEALITQNHLAYHALATELGTVPEDEQPRILIMGTDSPYYVKSFLNAYQSYLPPAQVRNATVGLTGQRQDTERILAMDADFIFLMSHGVTPQAFMDDPLWRGLKAVRDKRVYRMLSNGGGGLLGLTYQPVSVRWMAEIAHPERLQPKVREQLRELYFPRFGYRMSEAEIDADLHLAVNLGSAGYARFNPPPATLQPESLHP
jgi:ABC-type Fe3+-hydroxamate transport system substrate-binding protein